MDFSKNNEQSKRNMEQNNENKIILNNNINQSSKIILNTDNIFPASQFNFDDGDAGELEHSDEEEQNEQIPEKQSSESNVNTNFKEIIYSYIKIDDLIRETSEQIKTLKEKKKQYEGMIITFLIDKSCDHININGGKLIMQEMESKTPLNSEIIKESIKEGININDLDKNSTCERIIDLMETKREIVKKRNIKRTFDRKPKKQVKKKK